MGGVERGAFMICGLIGSFLMSCGQADEAEAGWIRLPYRRRVLCAALRGAVPGCAPSVRLCIDEYHVILRALRYVIQMRYCCRR